jgi:hypothetical protein
MREKGEKKGGLHPKSETRKIGTLFSEWRCSLKGTKERKKGGKEKRVSGTLFCTFPYDERERKKGVRHLFSGVRRERWQRERWTENRYLTLFPSQGLLIFFKPSTICTVYGPADSPCQVYNQSLLFREGLHNFYGQSDDLLQFDFGIPRIPCTLDINDYIAFTVYATVFNSCGP